MNNSCVLCQKPLVAPPMFNVCECKYVELNDYARELEKRKWPFEFGQEVQVDRLPQPRYKFCAPYVDDPENSCVLMDLGTGALTVFAMKRVRAKPSMQTLHVPVEVVEIANKYWPGDMIVAENDGSVIVKTEELYNLLRVCQAVAASAEDGDE